MHPVHASREFARPASTHYQLLQFLHVLVLCSVLVSLVVKPELMFEGMIPSVVLLLVPQGYSVSSLEGSEVPYLHVVSAVVTMTVYSLTNACPVVDVVGQMLLH